MCCVVLAPGDAVSCAGDPDWQLLLLLWPAEGAQQLVDANVISCFVVYNPRANSRVQLMQIEQFL